MINKIGQPLRGSPICQSRVITDRIGWQEVQLPTNHNCFNFRKPQTHLGQISPVETMSKVKTFLHFGNSSVAVAMVVVFNSVIGGFGWVAFVWLTTSTVP